MTYKTLASFVTVDDALYLVEFADGRTAEYPLYVSKDEYTQYPCVGHSSDKCQTPFPYFLLESVVSVSLIENK